MLISSAPLPAGSCLRNGGIRDVLKRVLISVALPTLGTPGGEGGRADGVLTYEEQIEPVFLCARLPQPPIGVVGEARAPQLHPLLPSHQSPPAICTAAGTLSTVYAGCASSGSAIGVMFGRSRLSAGSQWERTAPLGLFY